MAELVEVTPRVIGNRESFFQEASDCPRRAENLEGRKPEPVRLMFEPQLSDTKFCGEIVRCEERGRSIARETGMKTKWRA